MADRRDRADEAGLRRGLAVPCFAADPADLVRLGTAPNGPGLTGTS